MAEKSKFFGAFSEAAAGFAAIVPYAATQAFAAAAGDEDLKKKADDKFDNWVNSAREAGEEHGKDAASLVGAAATVVGTAIVATRGGGQPPRR